MAKVKDLYSPEKIILVSTKQCFHDGIPDDIPNLLSTGLLVQLDDRHLCATLLGRWFSEFVSLN